MTAAKTTVGLPEITKKQQQQQQQTISKELHRKSGMKGRINKESE